MGFPRSSLRKTDLPTTPARTRFAPSPTGYLHLGSLRTALFNYLLARATGGQFILRLEDTDRSRLVPDAEKRLYKDLRWAGLNWDEGPDRDHKDHGIGAYYGPYKQSSRLFFYKEQAERLVSENLAFRCFCTQEDLASTQQDHLASVGSTGRYPGTCRGLTQDQVQLRMQAGRPYTIRFKSSSIPVEFQDLVYGRIVKKHTEDDFIIMKSDGFPTYHFANVVDDHMMKITHVVRGAEWLISTPKHVDLYRALGWKPPLFAHISLLVDQNRQKLSKRNMDIGIDYYRDANVLPEALLNFAALLGWSTPSTGEKDHELMTLEELVKRFSLKFTKGDAMVDPNKLLYFQRGHLSKHLKESNDPSRMEFLVEPIRRYVTAIEQQRQPKTAVLDAIDGIEHDKRDASQHEDKQKLFFPDQVGSKLAQKGSNEKPRANRTPPAERSKASDMLNADIFAQPPDMKREPGEDEFDLFERKLSLQGSKSKGGRQQAKQRKKEEVKANPFEVFREWQALTAQEERPSPPESKETNVIGIDFSLLVPELGDPVCVSSRDREPLRQYISRIIAVFKGLRTANEPMSFIQENRFLLWMPSLLHQTAVTESFVQKVTKITLMDGEGDSVRTCSLEEAVGYLAERFRAIDEADWVGEGADAVLRDAVKRISYWEHEAAKPAAGSGWKVLRLALVAGDSGVPIAAAREVFGRTETLKRLEASIDVIKTVSKQRSEAGQSSN